jgi:hypothetical protein
MILGALTILFVFWFATEMGVFDRLWTKDAEPTTGETTTSEQTVYKEPRTISAEGCSFGDGSRPVNITTIPEGADIFGYWMIKSKADDWHVVNLPTGADTQFCINRKRALRIEYRLGDGSTREVVDTKDCSRTNSCKNNDLSEVDSFRFQALDLEEEEYVELRIYKAQR